jgi:tRNA A-37 threonylcarbamoyl transferase component Bud32
MAKSSPYKIIERVGEGGMGVVYRAEDTKLHRDVAIKVLRIDPERHITPEKVQEIRARFQKEAQASARLNHPNIVSIYQVGQSGDQPYIVMEYLRGKSLGDLMDGLPAAVEVIPVMMQVCDALEYAHRQGVVHRDVKPDNIVVSEDRRVKLTDFGIARVEDQDFMQTRTGVLLGSPAYCAPEQLRDFSNVDGRADIFSCGVVLYQWLTGRLPFEGEAATEVITRILTMDPVPPRVLNPAIPAILEAVILKALAKDVKDRFQSAAGLRKALENVLRHVTKDAATANDRTMTLEPPRRRAVQFPFMVAALLLMGLVAYGVISLWGELGLLQKTAQLRGTHMARMLEVVGIDVNSPENLRILQGYLHAMGKEREIVFLEVARGERTLAKFADQGRMIEEGDIYVKGFPLRVERGGEAMLLVGFSKAQYNDRVARTRTTLVGGGVLLLALVGGQLAYSRMARRRPRP